MMVAAKQGALFLTGAFVYLPDSGNGSKVDETHHRYLCSRLLHRPLLEVFVTSRLRELIQQLGEAIHESVIESEQIAGVVQDIRQHGFDVLLMLEATIGLNELSNTKEPDGVPTAGDEDEGSGSRFTSNDLHFLKSLRISVEGEEEETGSETDTK
jgi:hypothetical protein